jgi:hypothetical protein
VIWLNFWMTQRFAGTTERSLLTLLVSWSRSLRPPASKAVVRCHRCGSSGTVDGIGTRCLSKTWRLSVRVGDLVLAHIHTDDKILGVVTEVSNPDPIIHPISSMFPYHIAFFDTLPDDWYRAQDLEVISESR